MSSAGQLVTGVKHGKAIDVSGGVLREKTILFFVYCIVVKIVFFLRHLRSRLHEALMMKYKVLFFFIRDIV